MGRLTYSQSKLFLLRPGERHVHGVIQFHFVLVNAGQIFSVDQIGNMYAQKTVLGKRFVEIREIETAMEFTLAGMEMNIFSNFFQVINIVYRNINPSSTVHEGIAGFLLSRLRHKDGRIQLQIIV